MVFFERRFCRFAGVFDEFFGSIDIGSDRALGEILFLKYFAKSSVMA